MTATPARREPTTRPAQRRPSTLRERLESPVAAYYILLGAMVMLLCLGLVMVLSASSVTSYTDTRSSYTIFKNQLMFVAIGTVLALVGARLPLGRWKSLAMPLYGIGLLLQLAVFSPLGKSVMGNRNWLALGPLSMQPSEVGKLALVLMGAVVLTKKRPHLWRAGHAIVPFFVPLGLVLVGLVLLGHDLGTGLVLMMICGAMLWTAGVPKRLFAVAGVLGTVLVLVLVLTSGNRMGRIDSWLGTCATAQSEGCYQRVHALYAMADGGWWGVGLGASREKWFWLPEAHNDFIFAVIGEELGLPGTLIVLFLFAAVAFACYRIIATSDDFFVRVATAGVMVWIVGQALVNVGSVTGMLPVIGVPLPLVSSGGSALVSMMLALSMVIAFARQEPACREALAQRGSLLRRVSVRARSQEKKR